MPVTGVTLTATNPAGKRLVGTSNDDLLTGGPGNDLLFSNGGNDTISGGTGDDILNLADGNATADGGAGRDLFYLYSGNATVDGGDGDDSVRLNASIFTSTIVRDEAGRTTVITLDGNVFTIKNVDYIEFYNQNYQNNARPFSGEILPNGDR